MKVSRVLLLVLSIVLVVGAAAVPANGVRLFSADSVLQIWGRGFSGGAGVGAVFILHELGHQLVDITHFNEPDRGDKNLGRNLENTRRVLAACYQERK